MTPLDQETTYTFTVRARDIDGNFSPVSDPVIVTTDPADPNDHTPPTQPVNVTAENDGAFIIVRWDPSTDDLAPQSLIRYDVYVNGELRAVVVGETTAQSRPTTVSKNIAVIAVDTADNESAPGTTTLNLAELRGFAGELLRKFVDLLADPWRDGGEGPRERDVLGRFAEAVPTVDQPQPLAVSGCIRRPISRSRPSCWTRNGGAVQTSDEHPHVLEHGKDVSRRNTGQRAESRQCERQES